MKNLRFSLFIAVACVAPSFAHAAYGDTSTFVSAPFERATTTRTEAIFDFPSDIDIAASGNMYIADTYNNAIRVVTTDGEVATVAGTGGYGLKNGKKRNAEFAWPKGVAAGSKAVFVADTGNNAIRRIKGSKVKTIVTDVNAPQDVALANGYLYILDTGNNALKRSTRKGEELVTITTGLSAPIKMSISGDGRYAYVTNTGTYQVVRVDLESGAVLDIAGSGSEGDADGACSDAEFNQIAGIYMYDADTLYVTDGDGYTDSIRKISLSGCTVETVAQDEGMVYINFPHGIDGVNGKLYVVSTGISIIEEFDVDAPNDDHAVFAGSTRFNMKDSDPILVGNPKSLALSKDKQWIYFSENNRIRKMQKKNPTSATLIVGSQVDNYAKNDNNPKYGSDGRFSDPTSITVSADGAYLYVVDRNNHRIRLVDIEAGSVEYLTGAGGINYPLSGDNGFADGSACPNTFEKEIDDCAYFYRPYGSVLSLDGQYLYVTDTGNNRIRRVTVTGGDMGEVTTIAGSGVAGFTNGTGTAASFHTPMGITINTAGDTLYIADRDNHAIRAIDLATNAVTTLTGTGTAGYLDAAIDDAVLSYPESVTFGKNGRLYFSEAGSQRIRLVNFTQGVTKLVSGSGTRGYLDGVRTDAKFNNPKGLLKLKKKLLVAELYNDTIRAISTKGTEPYSDPAPEVTGLCSSSTCSVSKWWSTDGTLSITIEGSGFRHGARGWVGAYESTVYVSSSNAVVLRMPISSIPAGTYSIRIQNSDGQYDDLSNALVIND